MAYLLHLDTATDRGLYFIAQDGHILAQKDSGDNRDHAATLPGIVADLLRETNLSFTDLSAFAVNGGPGSYTGLRISLSAAKGYCFALQKPLLLENRLRLLLFTLQAATPGRQLLAILPARNGEYFVAAMDGDGTELLAPQHLFTAGVEEFMTTLTPEFAAIGALSPDLTGQMPEPLPPYYDASLWATVAYKDAAAGNFTDLSTATPYYLKDAFTTQPRKTLL